jgi:hypothetical protein
MNYLIQGQVAQIVMAFNGGYSTRNAAAKAIMAVTGRSFMEAMSILLALSRVENEHAKDPL